MRWDHPERGRRRRRAFIPIAEQSGLIVPIGAWVVEEACRQAAKWRARATADLAMAVNVSPRQLADARLPDGRRRRSRETGLDAAALCLEITESALHRRRRRPRVARSSG